MSKQTMKKKGSLKKEFGKGLDLFFTPKTPPVPKETKLPAKERVELYTWCDPSNIPFFSRPEYIEAESWIINFTQKTPFCVLFGPTSSGKSRIVQTLSTRYCLHLIEIDCASAKDIKSCIDTANEATQSRSVGSFIGLENDPQTTVKPTSMVVFEHIDALFTLGTKISTTLVNLLSSSRVPIIATCNKNFFKPNDWMRLIYVPKFIDAFSILKESSWFKLSKNQQQTELNMRKLLIMTENDMRRTSLQLMFNDSADKFLTPDEHIYHSLYNENTNKSNIDLALYPEYMDLLTIIDPTDIFWSNLIEPDLTFRPLDSLDSTTKEIYDSIMQKIPIPRTSYMQIPESFEIISTAARNAQFKTRTLKVLPFSKLIPVSDQEIEYYSKLNVYH